MLAAVYICGFVGAPWLYLVQQHVALHGQANASQVALALFQCINVLICWWEMSLFIYNAHIKVGARCRTRPSKPAVHHTTNRCPCGFPAPMQNTPSLTDLKRAGGAGAGCAG